MATYDSPFAIGDVVFIDGGDIPARVIALCWRHARMEVECAWWNNGALHSTWCSANRLHHKDGAA